MTAYTGIMTSFVIVPNTMYGNGDYYHPPGVFSGQLSDSVIAPYVLPLTQTHGVFWPVPYSKPTFEQLSPIYISGALNASASETSTMTATESFVINGVSTSLPARIRLYTSIAKRDADLDRPTHQEPTGDHGLLFEVVTTPGQLSYQVMPAVYIFAETSQIPITVTNISSESVGTITTTFNATGME